MFNKNINFNVKLFVVCYDLNVMLSFSGLQNVLQTQLPSCLNLQHPMLTNENEYCINFKNCWINLGFYWTLCYESAQSFIFNRSISQQTASVEPQIPNSRQEDGSSHHLIHLHDDGHCQEQAQENQHLLLQDLHQLVPGQLQLHQRQSHQLPGQDIHQLSPHGGQPRCQPRAEPHQPPCSQWLEEVLTSTQHKVSTFSSNLHDDVTQCVTCVPILSYVPVMSTPVFPDGYHTRWQYQMFWSTLYNGPKTTFYTRRLHNLLQHKTDDTATTDPTKYKTPLTICNSPYLQLCKVTKSIILYIVSDFVFLPC